ncbi:DEDD exnuclease domain-containing protein [Flaviflexus salsibiostraticola]|uniref:DEDD exnuclease domain-containing protein n=1 Tax=Flaviflexus salsibiostraticola TaxID=1282737 RepID=A0A3S8Z6I3_9ACTO|nr:DEDD exonuclease domain-containing protein [Flaviflexus salsibiostraticola]AZN29079.1 DEDD exnuclease domain-containing protein [Flaviflexus salsibiostraticola]
MAGRLLLEDARRAPEGVDVQMSFSDLGTDLRGVTFVVVDLETTGGRPGAEEITEIGAVKSIGGEVVGEFATLVNPNQPIPPYITVLTGITTAMVMEAPRIAQVLPAFFEFVGNAPDTVLVAHNARFDVGHLKAAAAALALPFPTVMTLDTVQLARRTITKDETPNYKLGTLARVIGTDVAPTHRALDDARATEELLQFMLGRLGPLGVSHLEDLKTVTDPVPYRRRLKANLADGLPRSPGVYRFIGPSGDVLYVGTSVNVYRRVRQYFTAAEKRRRIAEMVDLAVRVEATPTATRLESQVHELRAIQSFDPPYNRRSKRPDKRPWLVLTNEPHPRLSIVRSVAAEDMAASLGPFTTMKAAKKAKDLLERTSRVRTCTSRLPLMPSPQFRACSLLEMGRCSGPCVSGEPQEALTIARTVLSGLVDDAVAHTMENLRQMSSREEFERAADERDRLSALVTTAARRERLSLLAGTAELRAAKPTEHGWEIIIVRWGRLVGTAVAPGIHEVVGVAEALAASTPSVDEPTVACGAAPVEEMELLYGWVFSPGTRLLSSPATSLAIPRSSAQRHRIDVAR